MVKGHPAGIDVAGAACRSLSAGRLVIGGHPIDRIVCVVPQKSSAQISLRV
jgi:hypothetical protein